MHSVDDAETYYKYRCESLGTFEEMNGEALISTGSPFCRVLVVDDDEDCLAECVEMLGELGYECVRAPNGREALKRVSDDHRIGIVVTDIEMPCMDGLHFLEELSARFEGHRPIVPVVVTGHGTLPAAVQAMRFNAADMLSKPVGRADYAAALRRASSRWSQKVDQMKLLALALGNVVPDTGRADAGPAGRGYTAKRESLPASVTDEQLRNLIRSIVKSRQSRSDFLDPKLFADPAWEILLDLTSAHLEGRALAVSSVCAATSVPISTALRWIRQLVDDGLVIRWNDPTDRRRDLVKLSNGSAEKMISYLRNIYSKSIAKIN